MAAETDHPYFFPIGQDGRQIPIEDMCRLCGSNLSDHEYVVIDEDTGVRNPWGNTVAPVKSYLGMR